MSLPNLTPAPVQTYGYKYGNTPQENALLFNQEQNKIQSTLAKGGSKSHRRRSHRRRSHRRSHMHSHRRSHMRSHMRSHRRSHMRTHRRGTTTKKTQRQCHCQRHQHRKYNNKGGSGGNQQVGMPKTVEVPQFPQYGPQVSPVNANSSSIVGNTTAINGLNNATNDCYATNSCPK